MTGLSERWLGVAMLLGSGVCFSISGVLIRLIESATVWQVVFYRSASWALAVLLAMSLQSRAVPWRAFLSIGRFGAIGALGLAVGGVFIVWAQFHTSIANVVFILGALPFLSALMARLFLGEQVRGLTWLAMAAALVGIGVMVWGGIDSGRLLGNVLAIVGISGLALMTVALRHGRRGDTRPVFVLGGTGALIAALVVAADLAVSARDLALCVLMGAFSMAIGFTLFNRGARSVRAGEMWVLSNVEIVLGPFLVWLVIAEVPLATTFLGGTIVIAAILSQAVMTAREPAAR